MKKTVIVAAAVILPLSGCGLPPAISIASMLMDVGSYAATGKSATDHVISAMAGEDCAMMKIFEGNLCEEEQRFEDALATLQPLEEGEGATLIAQTEPVNYKTVYIDPVESGEPNGTQVGQVSPFVKVPVESSEEIISDDATLAGGEAPQPRTRQLAENSTGLLSSDPVIESDAFLSDADLPDGGGAPVAEPVSIFAPESVKAAAEPAPQPALEPVQQAALPAPQETVAAPRVESEPITAASFDADPFSEHSSLLSVAQERAVTGAVVHRPQDRQDDRSWHTAGSLGNNLRQR